MKKILFTLLAMTFLSLSAKQDIPKSNFQGYILYSQENYGHVWVHSKLQNLQTRNKLQFFKEISCPVVVISVSKANREINKDEIIKMREYTKKNLNVMAKESFREMNLTNYMIAKGPVREDCIDNNVFVFSQAFQFRNAKEVSEMMLLDYNLIFSIKNGNIVSMCWALSHINSEAEVMKTRVLLNSFIEKYSSSQVPTVVKETNTVSLNTKSVSMVNQTTPLPKAPAQIPQAATKKQNNIKLQESYDEAHKSEYYMPYGLGMFRGLAVIAMSPLNYFRAIPLAWNLDKRGVKWDGFVFLFPFAVIYETIPFVVDIGVGVCDFMTLGWVGNKVYIDGRTPWVWERSNNDLPWIDK